MFFAGSGINFSQLSLLANGIASRMSIHHGHAKVHHGGGGAHYEETKEGEREGRLRGILAGSGFFIICCSLARAQFVV